MAEVTHSQQLPLTLGFCAHSTFDEFVNGDNEVLVGLLKNLPSYDQPYIYVWGARGLGKTHLLQAICRLADQRGHSCAYLPIGEEDLQPEMLEGLEYSSIVCIDDVDKLESEPRWEHALFNFFNAIRARGNTLVVSAQCSPAALKMRLPDLRSRLSWGLAWQLKPLDDQTKAAALQQRAHRLGIDLSKEVVEYLLRRVPRDLPALFSLLASLDRASLAAQRKLTVPFVKGVLDLSDSDR